MSEVMTLRCGVPSASLHGQDVLHVPIERYQEVVRTLFDEGFTMCVDLTVVDYLTLGTRSIPGEIVPERFEVVVNLLSMTKCERVRLRVQVSETNPTIASLVDVYPGTEAMEREAFDLFGINFEGHPDLTRILMPEDWEGHPLRKDYDVGRIPVQFKGAQGPR